MAYIGTSPSNGVRRRFVYEATASQTSFSGSDENGVTLTYVDSLYLDVFQNGIKLKAGDDYTATTGTSVVLVQGASVNDVVEMVAFDVFSVNDSVSAKDGGSFAGNVAMAGTLGVTGALSAKGGAVFNEDSADVDFRVESNGNANMLFVDGGNDAVGIGNNNPADYGSLIDNLVIGTTSGNNGMTIVSGTADGGRICFADNTASPQRGMIEYSHGDDAMLFNANGATRMKIDSTGAVTKPLQPAFLVQPASEQSNIAEGSDVVVVFGTERFDNNADFASNVFTAPVTGKYLLTFNLVIGNVDSAPNYVETYMSTSNRQYASTIDPRVWDADALYWAFPMTVVADMDASDTAQVKINIHNGGTVQADIVTGSLFSGALIC